jgi:transposase
MDGTACALPDYYGASWGSKTRWSSRPTRRSLTRMAGGTWSCGSGRKPGNATGVHAVSGCAGYDRRGEARRWRSLDWGTTMIYLEAEVIRVSCPEHGVVVAHVPWARPRARHTYAFEDTVAWWTARAASTK